MSQSEVDHRYPGTDSDPGARLTKDPKPSVVTKKTSTKKALANNKKERHTRLASASRGELTHSKKQAPKAQGSGLKSETSYNIAGNIAPEVIELPIIPLFTVSGPAIPSARLTHSADGGATLYPSVHNVGPSSNGRFPNTAKPTVKTDPTKSRFTFESFANIDTSFTFVPNPSPASIGQCGDSQPSVFSAKAHVSNVGAIEKGLTTSLDPGRSIFDALAERCNTVPKTTGSERCSEEWRDQEAEETSTSPLDCTIVSTKAAADYSEVEPMIESLSAGELEESTQITVSSIWPVKGASCLPQLEMDHATCQKKVVMDTESHGNTDLVIYRQSSMSVLKLSSGSRLTVDVPVATWDSQRMFFVDSTGDTRVVDLRQTLYDINVEVDDGASDFDSIASPMKVNPLLAPISEHDEATSTDKSSEESSDQSSDEIDTDDLAGFVRIDCNFITSKDALADSDGTPATTLSFSDDEDVIDPCLVFTSTEKVDIVDIDHGHTFQGTNRAGNDAEGKVNEESPLDVDVVLVPYEEESLHENDPTSPVAEHVLEMAHSTEEESHSVTVIAAKTSFMDTRVLASIATAYVPVRDNQCEKVGSDNELTENNAVIKDEFKSAIPQEAFSSDWASELIRITIGTESLFNFFEHLKSSDCGSTTKTAIVTAFLQLINLERKKLGKRPLPSSYTAASVLSSKILPHTIFLGTSSLATLLAHFAFGLDGETTVDEVYHVFKALSKEDLLSQVKATKGVMGALGLRLAKLPSFQAT